jgi:hypothetical protein
MNYETHIKPFADNFVRIKISEDNYIKADGFAKKMIAAKSKEEHHKIDNDSVYKRFLTGTLGELALEQFFGVKGIMNWEIGESLKYHSPDLRDIGLKIGIKSVSYGLFPITFIKSYYPEIINIVYKDYVYICGVATVDVLNKYQSIELIKNSKLKARGTKTGFYGFNKLKKFSTLEDLKTITKLNSKCY